MKSKLLKPTTKRMTRIKNGTLGNPSRDLERVRATKNLIRKRDGAMMISTTTMTTTTTTTTTAMMMTTTKRGKAHAR